MCGCITEDAINVSAKAIEIMLSRDICDRSLWVQHCNLWTSQVVSSSHEDFCLEAMILLITCCI